jgi:hypothetical protein
MRGKTVVWIVVVAVLALIGAVVAIGYLLPIGHRASVDTEVSAPVEEVYALITQAENFPAWRSGVKSVDILDSRDGKRRYREKASILRKWTFELASRPDSSTNLRITEDGEVYNPVFRFVSRFVFGHDRTMKNYLADVRRATKK